MCKTMGLIVFAHTHIILFSTFTSLSLCPLPWPVISFLPLKVLVCFAFKTYLYVYMYEYVLKSELCMWDWMPCLPHISTLQPPLIYLPPIVSPLTNCPLIKTGFCIFFWVWLINFFFTFFFVCIYMPQCKHGGWRKTFRGQLLLSTMWLLRIDLGSSGLEAGTSTHEFISCLESGVFSLFSHSIYFPESDIVSFVLTK